MEKLGWHSLGASFDCPCGERHSLPIAACHVGSGAAAKLAAFAKERCGERVLVLSDATTRAVAGEAVLKALRDAGRECVEKVFEDPNLEADQAFADEAAAAGADCGAYVAIGAGTLSDLAKSAGGTQGKPVLLFPTAASMNGYTSAIVALKVRGLKRTLPCPPAAGIFADPEVVATAPQRMTAAGLADFLSKCSSSADWRAAHRLRGGYYCHRPREFNEGIQERLFEEAGAIGRGETEAVRLVLEALLLSGFGMVIAGSSAPASGGEHLISHFLDMKHALRGTPNDLHGTQVGVATVHTLGLWERALAVDPDQLDIEACVAAQWDQAAIEALIHEDWGDQVGAEVLDQWNQKRLAPEALREELRTYCRLLPQLREELAEDLQPAARVAQVIETAGGPAAPEGMHASAAEYRKALERARFLRNRFTILDLAAELAIA